MFYRCTFHVVWCPKYCRPVITGPVDLRLKEIIREVCAERVAPIVELETVPDHVQLLVTCDPKFGIHRLVKQIKGRSSWLLRQEFPSDRRPYPPRLKPGVSRVLPDETSSLHPVRPGRSDRGRVAVRPVAAVVGSPVEYFWLGKDDVTDAE